MLWYEGFKKTGKLLCCRYMQGRLKWTRRWREEMSCIRRAPTEQRSQPRSSSLRLSSICIDYHNPCSKPRNPQAGASSLMPNRDMLSRCPARVNLPARQTRKTPLACVRP
jgi:hypothetical protein